MKKLIALGLILSVLGCAQTSLPEGGPVDKTPPQITDSYPDSAAIFFKGNHIELSFDEFVVLNNLNNNLIVSPPLSTQPTAKLKKKTLRLEFNDTLLPNATYQFYFGKSIKDLNEGNEAKDLKLVFSTGATIDTGRLSGTVVSAFDASPGKNMLVFLYHELQDSQLIKEKPFYIAQTDDQGGFEFTHIQDKSYTIYAISDANNNYLLDPDESFAMLDTPVVANTLGSVLTYSVHKPKLPLRILKTKELFAHELLILFNQPLPTDNISISSNNHPTTHTKDNKFIWRFGNSRDSVWVDLPPAELDSFTLDVVVGSDSVNTPAARDTCARLRIHHVAIPQAVLPPNSGIPLKASSFIHSIKSTELELWDLTDSLPVTISGSEQISADSAKLEVRLKEDHAYQLVYNQTGIEFWNKASFTDTIRFKTSSVESTGILEVLFEVETELSHEASYYIVLKKDKTFIQKKVEGIKTGHKILFNYLLPGSYEIYLFEDLDKNEQWSGADYLEKLKTERIWRLKSKQEIRANWKNQDIPLLVD